VSRHGREVLKRPQCNEQLLVSGQPHHKASSVDGGIAYVVITGYSPG
jgi:hypothetical protein